MTAHFYAIHWQSWRREHPERLPDVDWLHEHGILTEDLDVTPVHRAWLRPLPTRRGDNKRWYDHLDADSAYHRCRMRLSEADRAPLDALVDALLCPHDGEHRPVAYGAHDHLLYPPALVAQIHALEADLSPLEAAMAQEEGGMRFDVFEQIIWEWLDVLARVTRQGPEWGLLVWVWV